VTNDLENNLVCNRKEPKGFTEYLNNSDYFKTQSKQDYKKYNALYNENILQIYQKVK
jgi:hypothetical protein